MSFLFGHGDANYWTIHSSKWQILASAFAVLSIVIGGIVAFFKFFKKDASQSNTSNIKNVEKSEISVNQRNNSK